MAKGKRSGMGLRGWLVVLADWSDHDRSEARERVAEGLAQLGQLSAGVAHELRNGLAAILGWAGLARRQVTDEVASGPLTEIEREGRQLARVVDEFLAFARPGSRALVECDLLPILRRVARDPSLSGSALEVEAAVAEAPLRGDADLLERAVRNLAADGKIEEARIVPPTSQNQKRIETDLAAFLPDRLEYEDEQLTWECEQLVRSYDPCISCATHFLDVKVNRK